MDTKGSWKRWIAAFIFAVAVIAVYKAFDNIGNVFNSFYYILELLTPFFIGVALAFFMYPSAKKIEKALGRSRFYKIAKIKHGLSVAIVFLSFLAIVLAIVVFLPPLLSKSSADFAARLPEYLQQIHQFLRSLAKDTGLLHVIDIEQIISYISLENLSSLFLGGDFGQYAESVKGITTTLMSIFMGLIICIYILLERDSLLRMCRKFFGLFIHKEAMENIGFYIQKVSDIFYAFFYSKVIDSLVIGIISAIGFTLLDVPFAIIMAICLALLNLIPYFGPGLGSIPAILVTLLVKDIYAAIWVGIFLLLLLQIDANVIGPKILSHSLGISPFWVIFSILVFGGLFGFWGTVIGVPAIAAIRLFILDYIEDGKISRPPEISEKTKDTHNLSK